MRKKWLIMAFTMLTIVLSLPLTASAVTINGENYNHPVELYTQTGDFGHGNVDDIGHTSNLLGSAKPVANSGYWYNAVIGADKSKQYGIGYTTSGGNYSKLWFSQRQCDQEVHLVGFNGKLESPYRGMVGNLDMVTAGPGNGGDSNLATVWFFWNLPRNAVNGTISGLDSSDASGAKIAITGTGLPNSSSYGTGEKYSKNGSTSVSETKARFGNYYVSAYIPNAQKYDVTYKVEYKRGSKYYDQGNTTTNQTYSGSGSFSTSSYYVESGGYLYVTVMAKKKGTVIADLYKGTGVTESYAGKTFNLYNSSGSYVAQATTDSSGYAYFYNRTYGTYTIKPANTPTNHYYDPASVSVNLNGESVKGKITLRRNTGTLKIQYDTEDGMSKGSARFKVTNPDGAVSYHYTDSGGIVTLTDVITGSYTVEQVSTPTDYEGVSGSKTVTVYRSSTTTVSYYNSILYDFGVTISVPRTVEQMQGLTATVVFRSYVGKSATGVPVQVRDGNNLILNITISIPARGSVTRTFSLDTSLVTSKTVSASVNSNKTKRESDMSDNYASRTVTVSTSTNLQIEFIEPNAVYREGMEVVSSYRVKNGGYNHVTPTNNLKVRLTVSYTQNGVAKSVFIPDKSAVIIPYGGDNLVFFKWRIPTGTTGVSMTAKVNPDQTVAEKDYDDNIAYCYRYVYTVPYSQTPDTRFEKQPPNGFSYQTPPARSANTMASWSAWEWINGWFSKRTYGVTLGLTSPDIEPDTSAPSREFKNGQWYMRSGYGINLIFSPAVRVDNRYSFPSSAAYTTVQSASAYLPEFRYSNSAGQYRSLANSGSGFVFPYNQYGRMHFTPLWFPNQNYIVQAQASEVWTPAGMLWGYVTSNAIKIVDSAYDDWFVGK